MPDHVHVFLGLNPNQAVSSLLQDLKGDSSKWMNDQRLIKGRFEWQSGYGAFSYGQSQIDRVVRYIKNQEEHHRTMTFLEESTTFLKKFNVPFDARYIFKAVE
uniref:transposase n=1 Tax=Larkinella humicola TaxID=2607654 RepID=UPI00286E67F4|nr:transposase [Larkinella humicola]